MVFNKDQLAKDQQDTGKHSKQEAHRQIEMRTIKSTIWHPWESHKYANKIRLLRAKQLSKCRFLFFNPENREAIMYLGERCWRQTTGEPSIPDNPPKQLSKISYTPYLEFLKNFDIKEDASAHRLRVDDELYKMYWNKVSAGPYLPALDRLAPGNRDEIAPSLLRNPAHRLPYPVSLISAPHVYPTQEDNMDLFPQVDWSMTVPDSNGDPMSIPLSPRVPITSWSAEMYTLSEWPKFAAQLFDLDFKKSNEYYTRQRSLLMDNTALRNDFMALQSNNISLRREVESLQRRLGVVEHPPQTKCYYPVQAEASTQDCIPGTEHINLSPYGEYATFLGSNSTDFLYHLEMKTIESKLHFLVKIAH